MASIKCYCTYAEGIAVGPGRILRHNKRLVTYCLLQLFSAHQGHFFSSLSRQSFNLFSNPIVETGYFIVPTTEYLSFSQADRLTDCLSVHISYSWERISDHQNHSFVVYSPLLSYQIARLRAWDHTLNTGPMPESQDAF